ncbi:MAG TPA: hypothetical protein PLU50_07420, partial [Pseudobdellovibrionaceae bacterium]|nr:hypothetical protein [Pseudobdellovibrionaceae bacterium]
LDILSKSIVEKYGGVLSTGIIPPGIEGSLDERPRNKKSDEKNLIQLRISVPQAVAEMLRTEVSSLNVLCESKVNIEVIPHDVSRNDSKNLDSPCHMILISYAGGYFDPEGYLSVLPSMVGKDWLSLFGEKAESIRQIAQGEPDRIRRAELYREFSKITQQEFRYIPGWIPTFSDFRNPKLSKRPTAFKFSYKLIDYDENLRNEEK